MLVAARPPLVAFNVELAPPATLDDARAIAALIREGGAEGLPGVRAIGLELTARGGVAQVSTNVEDHRAHAARAASSRRSRGTPPSPAASSSASPRGGVRRLSRRRARAQPPHRRGALAESSRRHLPMAQTKKKRRTKHRGNAAGVIESRGRTGRTPSAAGAQAVREGARRAGAPRPHDAPADVEVGDATAPALAAVVFGVLLVFAFETADPRRRSR